MPCQELTFATHSNRLITIAEHQAITEAKYFQKNSFSCIYAYVLLTLQYKV